MLEILSFWSFGPLALWQMEKFNAMIRCHKKGDEYQLSGQTAHKGNERIWENKECLFFFQSAQYPQESTLNMNWIIRHMLQTWKILA